MPKHPFPLRRGAVIWIETIVDRIDADGAVTARLPNGGSSRVPVEAIKHIASTPLEAGDRVRVTHPEGGCSFGVLLGLLRDQPKAVVDLHGTTVVIDQDRVSWTHER